MGSVGGGVVGDLVGFVAAIYVEKGSTVPWRDAGAWLPVYATLIDGGCLGMLCCLTRREGILTSASLKLTQNWQATAAVRYDIDAHSLAGTVFGIGYIDDCLIVALNYISNYTYSGNVGTDQRVMLQVSLRTLGGTAVRQGVGGL